jgi:hypothetical protein
VHEAHERLRIVLGQHARRQRGVEVREAHGVRLRMAAVADTLSSSGARFARAPAADTPRARRRVEREEVSQGSRDGGGTAGRTPRSHVVVVAAAAAAQSAGRRDSERQTSVAGGERRAKPRRRLASCERLTSARRSATTRAGARAARGSPSSRPRRPRICTTHAWACSLDGSKGAAHTAGHRVAAREASESVVLQRLQPQMR